MEQLWLTPSEQDFPITVSSMAYGVTQLLTLWIDKALGVSPGASQREIRTAYKRYACNTFPGNRDPNATQRILKIPPRPSA